MEPDITLERDHRLLILDAKWKAYGSYFPLTPLLADEEPRNASLTDDLNQMHAYRDGIRNGETQAVAAAWLLYPGRSRTPDEGIIAFPQSTPETPFGGGQIGALQLRPGNGMERLCDLVDKTFEINATP
jgi:5-methylcytosine-specific restriction endonuclease McrBC regulatory subunit McrC